MKKPYRPILLSAAAAAAALCIGAALLWPRPSAKAGCPQPVRQGPDTRGAPAAFSDTGAKYTVADYEGHLAVYLTANAQAPEYVTDVRVCTLPAADRQALKKGIPIYTEAQLTSILEDYSS